MGRGESSLSPPSDAKLETSTRVRDDSHSGQTCARSRWAKEVRTSNFRSQASQRYS